MSALDAITNELTTLEREDERVLSWRHASLLAAGYDHRDALKVALRPDIDLHLAVGLRRHGCHRRPQLASSSRGRHPGSLSVRDQSQKREACARRPYVEIEGGRAFFLQIDHFSGPASGQSGHLKKARARATDWPGNASGTLAATPNKAAGLVAVTNEIDQDEGGKELESISSRASSAGKSKDVVPANRRIRL